jgi:hypothetical protein
MAPWWVMVRSLIKAVSRGLWAVRLKEVKRPGYRFSGYSFTLHKPTPVRQASGPAAAQEGVGERTQGHRDKLPR